MFQKFKIIKKLLKIFFIDTNINKKTKKNLILLEFYNYYPSIIGFAYFLQILKQINKADAVCYKILPTNLLKKLYTYFFFHFSFISPADIEERTAILTVWCVGVGVGVWGWGRPL